MAVTLAKLSSQVITPLVVRAWAIVDTVFDRWSMRVADTRAGFIWHPIKKLYRKARKARRAMSLPQNLQHVTVLQPPDSSHSMVPSAVGHETFSEQTVDFLLSQHMDQSLLSLPDINFNLEGINYADLMNPDGNMFTINWADWDEFVRDAEGGPDPML
jgi:hypothetical protein